jgi:hypothetical protein
MKTILYFTLRVFVFSILLTLFTGIPAWGQDIIVKKNGDEIKATVEQVLDAEIMYRKFENPTGPIYSIAKADVFMIKYKNGSKDVFGNQPVNVNPKQAQPSSETNANIIDNSNNNENSISKFALSINPLGFLQFGPIINAEIRLTKSLALNTHVRFPSLGLIMNAIMQDEESELDDISGIAFGMGMPYFFGERQNKPYVGYIIDYQQLNVVYDKGNTYEWSELDKTVVFAFNGGYRFRFNNGFFLNTGTYLGVASTKWESKYTDGSPSKDGKDIVPFGMLELSLGIEF